MEGLDAHSCEQGELLHRYFLQAESKKCSDEWHANGPHSLSPFVPCASGRIPPALLAARLTASDALWDIGCGDGRILHQAALQYGCACVGIDIDASCIAEARRRALNQGVSHLCTFVCANMMRMAEGSLQGKGGWTELGSAAEEGYGSMRLRAPTALLLFITSHGLARLSPYLFGEWKRGGIRMLTCVENPNECFDFEAEDALFDETPHRSDWPVYLRHERDGIYVVPPCETSLEEWAAGEVEHKTAQMMDGATADSSEVCVLEGLLSLEEMDELARLGEDGESVEEGDAQAVREEEEGLVMDWSAPSVDAVGEAEDAIHAKAAHRVVHLHREGRIQVCAPLADSLGKKSSLSSSR
ncbi:MAG: hypothetical protein SGPRY_007845 [Prymnesium sp.]